MKPRKFLVAAARRSVVLCSLAYEAETRTQFAEEPRRVILYDRKPAATLRPAFGEACNDEMTTGRQALVQGQHIFLAFLFFSQEVQDCTVMPKHVVLLWPERSDICFKPLNRPGHFSESLPGMGQRRGGDVHDGDITEAFVQQPVYQHGSAATDIDNGGIMTDSGSAYKVQGDAWLSLVPADLLRRPGLVNQLPVIFLARDATFVSFIHLEIGDQWEA